MSTQQAQHTPGPWGIVDKHFIGLHVVSEGTLDCVCTISDNDNNPTKEERANARLIASAPELLAACKRARDELLSLLPKKNSIKTHFSSHTVIAECGTAIAKAEGK